MPGLMSGFFLLIQQGIGVFEDQTQVIHVQRVDDADNNGGQILPDLHGFTPVFSAHF